MITEKDVICIGKITKSHGVGGEVMAELYNTLLEYAQDNSLFLKIEGLLVPFNYEGLRMTSTNQALISFEDITTKEGASQLKDTEIFLLRPPHMEELDYQIISWHSFLDYCIYDASGKYIGQVTDVDDSSENILFYLKNENSTEFILPIHEDLLLEHIPEKHCITLNIPEGLLSLNN